MKIVHALGWYFPESLGGTEVYVAGLAERQRRAGHEVAVAAPLPGLDAPEHTTHEQVPVFRYPIPRRPSRDEARILCPARGSEHLLAYLRESRPAIFHVHTFTTGLGVFELDAARDLGIHVVATNHLPSVGYLCQRGALMRWGETPCDGLVEPVKCASCQLQKNGLPKAAAYLAASAGRLLPKLPGRVGTALGMRDVIAYNQTLQRRMLDSVDRFVLLNEEARAIVVRNGGAPEKLALNYLGISHPPRPKPPPDEAPTRAPVRFGYLGRFVAIKGVLDLARAFAALPKELELRVELRAPPGPEDTELRARFDAIAGGDARVTFAPAVAPSEVSEVLASYDVLCVPSRGFENGPTVVSEAFGAGTPVIGTRIGAMRELIKDGESGALVEPGDWRALAAVIEKLVTEPKTLDAWRRKLPVARTMDTIAGDYERLYLEILRTSA